MRRKKQHKGIIVSGWTVTYQQNNDTDFQVSETLVEESNTILPPDIPSFGITEVDIAV